MSDENFRNNFIVKRILDKIVKFTLLSNSLEF